ncbi:MAG: COX15/CtaA family protein [Acidobacteriia bacterium]|nr:COX15/CtaA family protein [Terriglobia bacterium]
MLRAEVRKAGSPPAASDGRAGHVPHAFARYAWGVLAFNLAVVLWGAYVRATGSGAGCGNHWPLCNGEVTPHSPTAQTVIEFTHRATSGPIDVALVALLLVWAFRTFPRRHPVRLGATLSMVFLLTEAMIGAALVLLGHVEKNASITRAYSLSTHLINTLTLLACLTLTAWWASGKPAIHPRGRAAWLAGICLVVVALLGVSGAIAALGDTLFPALSLASGLAQDWDPSANVFLRLRGLHPLIAAGAGAWLLFYAVSSAGRRPDVRGHAWTLVACLGAQILAGVVNLLLLAPIWMQMVHLLLADLLWISLVLLCASVLAVRAESA